MGLDNNLIWGEIAPEGFGLGFRMTLCCICSGLATSGHQRCTWCCRRVTYGEGRPCILDARLEFGPWLDTMVCLAHTLASVCHQQGKGSPWCPGVGPSWTRLCFINKPKESCRLGMPLQLTDGVGAHVCALSLGELWPFVIPKPKVEKPQFSGHKKQKRFHCWLVCLKQTDQ